MRKEGYLAGSYIKEFLKNSYNFLKCNWNTCLLSIIKKPPLSLPHPCSMGNHIGVRHCTTRFFWSCQVYTRVSTRRNGTHLLPIWNPFISSIPPVPNPFCGKQRTGRLCDGWRCGDTSDGIKITNHLLETDVIIANRNAEREKLSINKMLHWSKTLPFSLLWS